MAGGGDAEQSSGASSKMHGRPPVIVSPSDRRPPQPLELPMAHAENAAVESALTFMMTSGLGGEPNSSATVASVGTPSGELGSALAAAEYAIHCLDRCRVMSHVLLTHLPSSPGRLMPAAAYSVLELSGARNYLDSLSCNRSGEPQVRM